MRSVSLFALFVFSALCLGCGNPAVTGTVTYPDGTPLDVGKVMFTDGSNSGFGKLNAKGEYKIGMVKEGDGLPAGTYSVYILEAVKEDQANAVPDDEGGTFVPKVLIVDPKFADPKKSGLSCTVNGKTTFDITVEKPGPDYKPRVTSDD